MKLFSRLLSCKVQKLYRWLLLLLIPIFYFQWRTLTLIRSALSSDAAGGINIGIDSSSKNLEKSAEEWIRYKYKDFDEYVLGYIRTKHLTQYDPNRPTNYRNSGSIGKWRKMGVRALSKQVAKRFKFKNDGFFVECGALDGAVHSNTILLERLFQWTGLLIEPDPLSVNFLKKRNRHAWVADVCLSMKNRPMKVPMTGRKDSVGHPYIPNSVVEVESLNETDYSRKFTAQCFPLSMLMGAIKKTEIDYLSLAMAGVELDVLKTIPFRKIHIKLISVTVREGNKEAIRAFLEPIGYRRVLEVAVNVNGGDDNVDDIFDEEENLYELQG